MSPSLADPFEIRGRGPTVRFPNRLILAPMEGITDPVFRDLMIGHGGVGGAITEFIRISVNPIPRKVVARSLGTVAGPVPVGVQFMAADEEHLAASIVNAQSLGAPWFDLNFGCPAPVVFSKCAGSALLDHPDRLATIVRTAVAATDRPVSAKMRAGVRDPGRLRELVLAAAEAGAVMITLHARLRVTSYDEPATWSWITDARRALDAAGYDQVPLVGNGGIAEPGDAAAMMEATGCAAVMIGRASLADPWIFRTSLGLGVPSVADGAAFALRYAEAILAERAPLVACKKLKQMTRWYRCGGIFTGCEDDRRRLLRSDQLEDILAWYRSRLGAA